MSGIVVFPDAVAVTLDHLAARLPLHGLDPMPTHREIPEPRPVEFVRVLRTGGVQATIISDAAQLTFEAWAATSDRAHDIAQIVRGIVNDRSRRVWAGVQVHKVEEFSGPQDFPDPTSNQQRYTWTAVVRMRGAESWPTDS